MKPITLCVPKMNIEGHGLLTSGDIMVNLACMCT